MFPNDKIHCSYFFFNKDSFMNKILLEGRNRKNEFTSKKRLYKLENISPEKFLLTCKKEIIVRFFQGRKAV